MIPTKVYRNLNTCSVTKSATTVLRPFVSSKKDPWYDISNGYNTGCDIAASTVYSICSGVIVQVGKDSKHHVATIQYNRNICIRYTNLSEVSCEAGELIQSGDIVGIADKYTRVECIMRDSDFKLWPVRIGKIQYYKVDPEPYVDGSVLLQDSGMSSVTFVSDNDLQILPYHDIPRELRG